MIRSRVLIATTRGPSAVQRITAEDAEVKSVVCLDGKAMSLPISAAYEHFVRYPTGVIEHHFGHPSFRLDVEHPIEDGASWQLGVFIAHALAASGALAGKGTPCGRLIWCTGEVDHDLAVRPVEHVAEKIERSEAVLRAAVASGTPVWVVLPRGNRSEAAPPWLADLRDQVRIVAVGDVAEACRALGLAMAPPPAGEEAGETVPHRSRPSFLALSVMVLAGVLAVLAWILFGAMDKASTPAIPLPPQAQQTSPAGAEAILASSTTPLLLGLAELRQPGGGECPPEGDSTRLAATKLTMGDLGRFPTSRLAGLCAIKFTVRSREHGRHIWAFAQMVPERVFLLADTRSLKATDAGTDGEASWIVPLPQGRTKPLRYVFVALSSSEPLADAATLLPRHIDWSGGTSFSQELKALAAELAGRGITLVMAGHEAMP
ncbi:MAG: hypothetical protein EPN20_10835 [Magnetospirillum sp.]|nr:MAG: hypothetical protein EPN20_10835 [Magnetospirillum sp.]